VRGPPRGARRLWYRARLLRGRRGNGDRGRAGAGDAGVHEPGAGERRAGPGRPERPLQPRVRDLRNAGWRAAAARPRRAGHHGEAGDGDAATAARPQARRARPSLARARARVEGLRVASRTAVFALKGKPQDVRAIGALLGAAWVLEGTVRRAGDHLRISAQLTSTEDGQLLWSERYDRTLADVFAIQEEIARTIVDTLRVTTFADSAAPSPKRYTESIAAHGPYLRGRSAPHTRPQDAMTQATRYA